MGRKQRESLPVLPSKESATPICSDDGLHAISLQSSLRRRWTHLDRWTARIRKVYFSRVRHRSILSICARTGVCFRQRVLALCIDQSGRRGVLRSGGRESFALVLPVSRTWRRQRRSLGLRVDRKTLRSEWSPCHSNPKECNCRRNQVVAAGREPHDD